MRIALVGDSLTAGVPGSSYLELLRRLLPGHTLINLGVPNDTVYSLHRRIMRPLTRSILRRLFAQPADLAFLWIGINDVGKHASWWHGAYARLRGRRRARHVHEFRSCYREVLAYLGRVSRHVVAVAPLLKGEDLSSALNGQVRAYARVVEELVREDGRAHFMDLWPAFAAQLAGRPVSGYLPRDPLRVIWDSLTVRTAAQVDRCSRRRGLHLTLDGLHLNGAGAALVAAAFRHTVAELETGPAPGSPADGDDRAPGAPVAARPAGENRPPAG